MPHPNDIQLLQNKSSLLASLVYLASAGVMLAGIGQVLEPLWAQRDIAGEKFACVAALHGYEFALLLAALIIVLWKHVVEDAVALVLLFVAFLIGAAASLDVVAPDFAPSALLIGLAACVFALSKIWAMQRWLVHPLSAPLWLSFALLLGVNFALPGALGITMSRDGGLSAHEMIDPWLVGWYLAVAASLVPVVAAVRLQPGSLHATDGPLLHRPVLLWYLVMIALGGTFFHQAALLWTFNLPAELAIVYPAVGLLAIYNIAVRRALGRNHVVTETAALCVALVSIIAVTAADQFWIDSPRGLGMINYPLTVALLMALACAALAWYWRAPRLLAMAGAFACCAALLFGVVPDYASPDYWNWTVAGLALIVCLTAVGLALCIDPLVAIVSAGYLPLFAFRHEFIQPWTHWTLVAPWLLGVMITGLALLAFFTCAHRRINDRAVVFASVVVSGSCFAALIQSDWTIGWQMSSLFVVVICAASAWRTGRKTVAVVGCIPLGIVASHHTMPLLKQLLSASSENAGWSLVAAGFFLLAAGTLISLTKQHWLRWLSPHVFVDAPKPDAPESEMR